jgi:hypothetical protein
MGRKYLIEITLDHNVKDFAEKLEDIVLWLYNFRTEMPEEKEGLVKDWKIVKEL